jgi:hypothetical protein
MSVAARSTRHAGRLYGKTFSRLRRPVKAVEAEAEHLHEIETRGEAPETPAIAFLGIFLFLLPIFLTMLGLAFGAYYLFK